MLRHNVRDGAKCVFMHYAWLLINVFEGFPRDVACQVLTVQLSEWRMLSLPLSISLWSHFSSATSVNSYHCLHSHSVIFISASKVLNHILKQKQGHSASPPNAPHPLRNASPHLPPSDSELCDPSPGCGRVQHFSDAQEPREEPKHGRLAAGPLPGLPGHHRRREQQLHQCGARRQFPPACCLCGYAAPAAQHHHWLLEAPVWLRLHLGGDAQPAQPVQLCLGKEL